MRTLGYISLVLLLLISCSKIKRTQKKLQGEWTIYSYRIIEPLGLTYWYEVNGTITFGAVEGNDDQFTYEDNYTYQGPSGPVSVNRTGVGTFTEKTSEYYDLMLNAPSSELITNCRIILITKDDLKIEHGTPNGTHIYVLQKD